MTQRDSAQAGESFVAVRQLSSIPLCIVAPAVHTPATRPRLCLYFRARGLVAKHCRARADLVFGFRLLESAR